MYCALALGTNLPTGRWVLERAAWGAGSGPYRNRTCNLVLKNHPLMRGSGGISDRSEE